MKRPGQYKFQVGDTVYLYGRTRATVTEQCSSMPGLCYRTKRDSQLAKERLESLQEESTLISAEEYAARLLAR